MSRKRGTHYKPSDAGMPRDIENKIIEICQEGFEEKRELKYLDKPNHFVDMNPAEQENIDIPSLYAWCNGFTIDSTELGAGTGKKVGRNMEFFCNIQYIIPLVETKEAAHEIKKLGWWLCNWIDQNLGLGDIAVDQPSQIEVDFFPKLSFVNGSVQKVSNLNLKIAYPYRDRQSRTRK